MRVPGFDCESLPALLDCGLDGVVAPRISSVDEATSLVRALRYAPEGSRGFRPDGGVWPGASAVLRQPPPACVIQIESSDALEVIDQIAAVDGVDALVVGTADLSFDMGEPLNLESGAVESASRRVAAAAASRGLSWGLAAAALPEWIIHSRAEGAGTLTFASDLRLYTDALEQCADQLRALPAD